MQVMIFAGGRGTRKAEETTTRPNCSLTMILPEIWSGFKGMGDPSRRRQLDPFHNHIFYDWAVKH